MRTVVFVVIGAFLWYILYYYVIPMIGVTLVLRNGFKNKYWNDCRIHNGEINIEYMKGDEKIKLVRHYNTDSIRFIVMNMRSELSDAYKYVKNEIDT